MRIYRVRHGKKIITARRMKVVNLNTQFISMPNTNINETDEVFVRCNKKGKPKYYNKQYIVFSISLPVVEVLNYDKPIVRFFKKIFPH